MKRWKEVLVIDPGVATGWSSWYLPPDSPGHRRAFGVIHGGLEGFIAWIDQYYYLDEADVVVFERYIDSGDKSWDRTFAAQRIEGALVMALARPEFPALHAEVPVELVLRNRTHKGGVRDEVLKRSGLWLRASDVDHEDANDVNDTSRHFLSYVRDVRHAASLSHYWPDSD